MMLKALIPAAILGALAVAAPAEAGDRGASITSATAA